MPFFGQVAAVFVVVVYRFICSILDFINSNNSKRDY